jgi:hypothetical protein
MKPIEELFVVHRARSHLFSDYSPGSVAYVGNGFGDNAVVGFVEALPKDKVFKFTGIAISAFCEATIQAPPFIACGRAGNGLVVLEPKNEMQLGQLAYVAAYVNSALRWKFSWYWQTTADRVKRLPIPDEIPALPFDVLSVLPKATATAPPKEKVTLGSFTLEEIYNLLPGDFHNAADLKPGPIPLVSCGDEDNGVIAHVAVSDHVYQNKFTIALNGRPLTAKYHPYRFSAKDDVAVCVPKSDLKLTTEMFILAMLNRERWRYSYYRKCYMDKLRRFRIPLPTKAGAIDEAAIKAMIEATPYWEYIKTHLPKAA